MSITRPSVSYLNEGGVRGESPSETFGPDESSAERIIRVPWNQRYSAVSRYLGYSQFNRDGSGNILGLQRLTPLPFPDLPNMLYATRTRDITGWKFTNNRSLTDGSKGNQYDKAEIRIGYEHVPYIVKEDYGDPGGNGISDVKKEYERFTYVSGIQSDATYLSLPGGALKFMGTPIAPKGLPVNYGVGRILNLTTVSIRWMYLPYDIYSLVSPSPWQKRIWGDPDAANPTKLIGCINKTQLFSWKPGTALMQPPELEIQRLPAQGLCWNVTFKFVINVNSPKGWNWLYWFDSGATSGGRGNASGYYYVGSNTDGTIYQPGTVPDGDSLYSEAELNDCFNVLT